MGCNSLSLFSDLNLEIAMQLYCHKCGKNTNHGFYREGIGTTIQCIVCGRAKYISDIVVDHINKLKVKQKILQKSYDQSS